MDIEKALEYTRERIESISHGIYENEHQKKIADEGLEYLRFVEKILKDKSNIK